MNATEERAGAASIIESKDPEVESAAAVEERRRQAIREGRGMLKRPEPKTSVERFLHEKHAETAREEARVWAWIAGTYEDVS